MTRMISSDKGRDVSLLAIDQYMRQVRWTETLSRDEEAVLVGGDVRRRHPAGECDARMA